MNAPPLSDLALRWYQERQQGRAVSAQELCQDRPELVEELERMIRAMGSMEAFLGMAEGPEAHATDATDAHAGLPQLPGFEVLRVVGRGGMGVVYEARQSSLGRVVAVKMILAGDYAGPRERTRFRAEAEALGRLQHPNIIQIFEVGEQDGQPFFVLEFLEGGSLAARLDGAPQDPRDAAGLVETLARAVHAAHEKGVVHRDLKPANVLLTADGTPKVADFGLARRIDAERGATPTVAVFGTPAYMAPEQAAGDSRGCGASGDIYSLGAILYEMLTGRPPFQGATVLETLDQVKSKDPVPPRRLRRGVPRDLETICLMCLRKEPARRYATALELAEDLRRFRAGEPIRARPISSIERVWRAVRRRPAFTALALVCAASLLLLGMAAMRSPSAALPPPAAPPAAPPAVPADASLAARRQRYVTEIVRALQCWQTPTQAGCEAVLRGIRDDATLADLRSFEWYYLWNRCHREPLFYKDLSGSVMAVDVSPPDGALIATGTSDGDLMLWDASGKGEGIRLGKRSAPVRSVAFSPDGKLLASGGGFLGQAGELRLWDVAARKMKTDLSEHLERVFGVAFSQDGGTLVTCTAPGKAGSEAQLWSVADGKIQQSLTHPVPGHAFLCCAFAGGASQPVLLGDTDGRVYAWNPPAEPSSWDLYVEPPRRVWYLSRSPTSGSVAFIAQPNKLGVLPATTAGAKSWELQSDGSTAWSTAFAGDNNVVASGHEDGSIRLWDTWSNPLRASFRANAKAVQSLKFSPNRRTLVSGAEDGRLAVWDVAHEMYDTRNLGYLGTDRWVHKEAWAVAFSPDGKTVASVGEDDGHSPVVRLWDADTGQAKGQLAGHEACVSCVAYSPDGALIASGDLQGQVILWNTATGKPVNSLYGHVGAVRTLAFSPDGRMLATGGNDQSVNLWDVKAGVCWRSPICETDRIRAVAFSPDGRTLVKAGQDGTIHLWNLPGGQAQPAPRSILTDEGEVRCVAYSPDGLTLATGDKLGWVRLWDPATGKEQAQWKASDEGVNTLAFTPDGKTLATGGDDQKVNLWQAVTGEKLLTFTEEPTTYEPLPKVNGLAFDRDGRTLATASHGGAVRLWRGPRPAE